VRWLAVNARGAILTAVVAGRVGYPPSFMSNFRFAARSGDDPGRQAVVEAAVDALTRTGDF
jgi:hypothetical protein